MNKTKRTGAPRARNVTQRGLDVTGPIGLLTPEQAAQQLNPDIITASWLREQARKREIEFTMIAGKVAFTGPQLAALIEKFSVPAGPTERPATEPRRRRVRETTTDTPVVTQLRARPPQRLRRAVGDGRG
jgi:hypothetical protein